MRPDGTASDAEPPARLRATGRPPRRAAVRLEGVRLALGRGASAVNVLNGVDLAIAPGESLGITGTSGSGKSTLLMVMGGLERGRQRHRQRRRHVARRGSARMRSPASAAAASASCSSPSI